MVSYKKMYDETLKKLSSLESCCIDLLHFPSGNIITFYKQHWEVLDDEDTILIKKR